MPGSAAPVRHRTKPPAAVRRHAGLGSRPLHGPLQTRPAERASMGRLERVGRLGHRFGRVSVSPPRVADRLPTLAPAPPTIGAVDAAAPAARSAPASAPLAPAPAPVIQRFPLEHLWPGARTVFRGSPRQMWREDESLWGRSSDPVGTSWSSEHGSKSGEAKKIAHTLTAPVAYGLFGGWKLGKKAATTVGKPIFEKTHELGKDILPDYHRFASGKLSSYHDMVKRHWQARQDYFDQKRAAVDQKNWGGFRKGLAKAGLWLGRKASGLAHGLGAGLGYLGAGVGAGLGYIGSGLAAGGTYLGGGLLGAGLGGAAGALGGAAGLVGGTAYGLGRTARGLLSAVPGAVEQTARQAPSVEGVEANLLQSPQSVLNLAGHPGNLSGIPGRSIQAGTRLQEAGALAQTGSGLVGMFRHGYRWATGAQGTARRALGKRRFKEAASETAQGLTSTGRFVMSGLSKAGSLIGTHAAHVLGKITGPLGGALSAAQGFISGKRAHSARMRLRRLKQLDPTQTQHPPLTAGHVTSNEGQRFLGYAQRKNRWQLGRGIQGGIAGGLGAAGALALGLGALGAATAFTPVGWGLAGAGALIGLGIGAHKLGRWAYKKYKAGRAAGYGRGKALYSIVTKGRTRLAREAQQNLLPQHGANATEAMIHNPLMEREGHARWLSDTLRAATNSPNPPTQEQQEAEWMLNALGLGGKRQEVEDPNEGHELVMHKLRSGG